MNFSFYVTILVILGLSQSNAQSIYCNTFDTSVGCECVPETREVRCEKDLTPIGLQTVGTSLNTTALTYWLLFINGTNLTSIENGTFNNAITFERIFIVNNNKLDGIHPNAFGSLSKTANLYITNNTLLNSSVIELVAKSGNLSEVDFRGNNILKVPKGSFDSTALTELKLIRLDGQANSGLEVENGAFANLPKLEQLTLDNKVIKLNDGSIDLTGTKDNSYHHVEIYIRNSNISSWKPDIIKLPTNTSVWLDLIGNTNLTNKLNFDEFKTLLNSKDNKLFISNSNHTCVCEDVKSFLLLTIIARVNGLVCNNFDDCINF